VRDRIGQWQEVEPFSRRTIIIRRRKNFQAFLRKKQTLSAPENRIQNAPMTRPRLIALLLALTTLLVYLPVTHYDFVNYDDQDYVTENSVVQNGLTWTGIKWAFTTGHASNWHPVTWLSHMTDCKLFGTNPGGPHLVNVLFHTANTVLLFALLLRLTNSLWPAAFIAALFAWHPLHVESVAWVAERKDVLSTFFALLTLLSYVKYVKENSRRSFWFALILFALGLMSKPMLVTLPFVMLLLDYWPLGRVEGCKLKIAGSQAPNLQLATFNLLTFEKWPFFLLTAISCVATFLAQHHGGAVMALEQFPLNLRLENALISYGRYLLMAVWPVNLAVIYPLPSHLHWMHAAAATFTAVLLVISWLVWRGGRAHPYLPVGWLWFLGTLVPVIGLVQVGGAALADRYTYFPLIGIFIAVTFGVCDLAKRFQIPKMIPAVAAILILAVCLALTENQLRYWRDSETLFTHALAVTEDNHVAHVDLGVALEQKGEPNEALEQYRAAEKIAPELYHIHSNLGNLLNNLGQPEAALAEYQQAALLNPGLPVLHARLGDLLLKQGRDAEAIAQFNEAVKLDPLNYQTLAHAAYILAAIENPAVRDGKTALILAVKANVLAGGTQPLVFDILGMAFAENGDFTNAQNCAQNALDLANAAKMKKLESIQQRLELYKNHRPWRESFLATNAPPGNPPKN
jgi:tetratricopeptide (TPR) repeat protein